MISSGDILELAVETENVEEYRNGVLELLQRAVGFDVANLISSDPAGNLTCVHRGFEGPSFLSGVHAYMNEFTASELRIMSGPGCCVESDWMSPARRDQLRLHRELLRPLGVRDGAGHMWRNRYGVYGLYLARAGRGSRFSGQDREQLNRLRLPLQLGEVSFARSIRPGTLQFAVWARSNRLSRCEQAVAEPVIRGLRNVEVAQLLGISPHTVRNLLAAVFRKVGVSTRAELAFVASEEMKQQPAGFLQTPQWIGHVAGRSS